MRTTTDRRNLADAAAKRHRRQARRIREGLPVRDARRWADRLLWRREQVAA